MTGLPLAGRNALVTGASRGIGRAIALGLASAGASVAVNYAHAGAAASEVVDQVIRASGARALAIQADLGVPADVNRLFDEALEAFGGLDILVNNAGLVHSAPTADVTEDDIARVLAVNVTGPLLAMRRAARSLRDGGRVINISTGYTRNPQPGVGLYTASKAALEALGRSLAKELGPRGITVNTVLPGLVDTDAVTAGDRSRFTEIAGMTPLGRIGEPDDIADVVSFLASDAARWITGQSLAVTGGLSF